VWMCNLLVVVASLQWVADECDGLFWKNCYLVFYKSEGMGIRGPVVGRDEGRRMREIMFRKESEVLGNAKRKGVPGPVWRRVGGNGLGSM